MTSTDPRPADVHADSSSRTVAPLRSPDWKRVIGIIGGLGPYAHLEFERHLLRATAERLGRPARDQDYPSWLLSSLPTTPDRTDALLSDGISPLDALVQSASRLSGADFAVIPCNTAHAFLGPLRERVDLPIIDMVDEAAAAALAHVGNDGCIGVLAATGTLHSHLYQNAIAKRAPGARIVTPLDLPDGDNLQESLVMEPIFGALVGGNRAGGGIKSGAFQDPTHLKRLAGPMIAAARKLSDNGAQIILLACTEIPLVLTSDRFDESRLLDPMRAAADASISIALDERSLP